MGGTLRLSIPTSDRRSESQGIATTQKKKVKETYFSKAWESNPYHVPIVFPGTARWTIAT
jgi:hypothetical protein